MKIETSHLGVRIVVEFSEQEVTRIKQTWGARGSSIGDRAWDAMVEEFPCIFEMIAKSEK